MKCKNCGGGEIDTDPARGDAVCTSCGSVLEQIIVSVIQFEERTAGAASVVGQFVSSESKGGPRGLCPNFQSGYQAESRELTLSKAKKRITHVAQILRINQTCIDMAYNFFKMALNRDLTRGRRSEHVIGACLYLTCRLEGTPHMLVDFCDALDIIGVYALGRTFLRISSALCIRVPTPDPCLYVMRFAGALKFGSKTHMVTMSALRLISRMKRDNIHIGRHASGLCGAALLLAARMHDFNRSVKDIVKVVKVHQSTVRKRLMEFGETPSSQLSIDEFMTVDLEEEQDPPSFRAARKKDRTAFKIPTNEDLDERMIALQKEIERELQRGRARRSKFFGVSVDGIDLAELDAVMSGALDSDEPHLGGIPPTYESLGLDRPLRPRDTDSNGSSENLSELDDKELEAYILTPAESRLKRESWLALNEDFLKKEKEREELRKVKEAGKPEKKKRKYARRSRKDQRPMNSANEAIEKVIHEKRLSNKINYEVLRNLTLPEITPKEAPVTEKREVPGLPEQKVPDNTKTEVEETEEDVEDELDEVLEPVVVGTEISLQDLLSKHRNEVDEDEYDRDMDEEEY